MSSRRLAEPDSPSDTMTSVRIYIPATSADVSKEDLLPRLVHAVTRELEHAMPAEGEEVLESVAMGAAADARFASSRRSRRAARRSGR